MYLQEFLQLGLKPEEVLDYLRKSQSDDPLLTVEEVLSKHETILDNWAQNNLGGKVPEENKFREVVSGETLKERPEIQRILRLIESPRIKAIKCVEPQRLTRGDLEDIGRLMKLLRLTHTLVITPDEFGGCRIYDLNDEYDANAFESELKKGNDYLKYTKKILNRGRLLAVSQGFFIGNTVPYGYNKTHYMDGKRKCHTLEPNPNEAPVVQMIFEMYKNGNGVQKIIDRLMELGIPSQREKGWAPTTIRTMLSNEHYLGKIRWYHKREVQTVEEGEVIKRRKTAEEYLLYPGKHPAIIDQETFDAVQAIKGTHPRNKKASNLVNPLSGLLYCSCGMAMKRHAYVIKGFERAAPRYACTRQKYCENASCTVEEVMQSVKGVLRSALDDFEIRVANGEDKSIDIHNQLLKRLERRLAELEALEIAQWDKYTQEGMPKHVFDRLNEKVLAEKEEVRQGLCTARNSTPEPIDLQNKISTFRKVLDMLDDPDPNIRELNALLKECIERITYSRPKAQGIASHWKTGASIELDVKLRV